MPGTPDAGSSGVAPAIATYLNSVDPYKRAAAVAELARSGGPDAFSQIVECFDDHSPHVRNAAARAFRKLEPKHTVDLFNRSLEGASDNRRRNIGAAIAASGLASEAIENLASENREDTYNALSILFVMAKTGELHPLVRAIEGHESVQVRMAAIKLLTLTGQAQVANAAAKRRLETKPSAVDYLS
jgi:HEAT repeat protein